jgi:mono-ADP-ribosyltransferase sirtuin 6
MSLGYAERLTFRDDLGGQLGAPEIFDDAQELQRKARELAQMASVIANSACWM